MQHTELTIIESHWVEEVSEGFVLKKVLNSTKGLCVRGGGSNSMSRPLLQASYVMTDAGRKMTSV